MPIDLNLFLLSHGLWEKIVFFLFCIELVQLVNSPRIIQSWMKATESFLVAPTHVGILM